MKKIALALAISSALTTHFALAADGDGEAPTLQQMEIKTNQELEDNLNKVRGNAGNDLTKESSVKTEKTANSVPVSDTGVYNALKALDEGRLQELQKDIRRGNEINARILANAVSGKIEKDDLKQAEEKAILSCSKQLASTLDDADVKKVFENTPLADALKLGDTSSLEGILGSIGKIGEMFNKFKELTTNFSIDKIVSAVNIPGLKDFSNLTSLDINQLTDVGGKIKELEGQFGNAKQAFNGATAGIKTSAYNAVDTLTKQFKDKLETTRDRELFNDSVKRVTEQCDKAADVADTAAQGVNKEADALEEARGKADAVLAGKCQSAREAKNSFGESAECKRVLGLGS